MAIVPQQQGLPFVVEPVSPQQVQLWASYAGQTSTLEGFDLVSRAFNALWWQAAAFGTYQDMLGRSQPEVYVLSQAFSLGMLVNELRHVAEYWMCIVRLMNEQQALCLSSCQWIEDAMQGAQVALDLRSVVVRQVVVWCEAYQLALPEYTQAFFAEMQAKGL